MTIRTSWRWLYGSPNETVEFGITGIGARLIVLVDVLASPVLLDGNPIPAPDIQQTIFDWPILRLHGGDAFALYDERHTYKGGADSEPWAILIQYYADPAT